MIEFPLKCVFCLRWFMVKWCWGRSVLLSFAWCLLFSAACWLSLGCRSLITANFACFLTLALTFRRAQQDYFTLLCFWRSLYLRFWWPQFPIHLSILSQTVFCKPLSTGLKCVTGTGKQGTCNCSLVGILRRLFGRPWWSLHIQVDLDFDLKLTTEALQRRECSTVRKQGTRRICTWGGRCVSISTAARINCVTGKQWDWEFPGDRLELCPAEGYRGGHQSHCWHGNSLTRGGEQWNSGHNH